MNKKTILINEKPFEYEHVELHRGRGALDLEISKDNLLDFRLVMSMANVNFGIIYGTLLGAVRDNNFIAWDEGVDVFILHSNLEKFHKAIIELDKIGLKLIRATSEVYSVMRNNNYIDIYIFKENRNKMYCGRDVVDKKFLFEMDEINFLGVKFFAPKNRINFLSVVYGNDWMTPKKNSPARPWSFFRKLKFFIKKIFKLEAM